MPHHLGGSSAARPWLDVFAYGRQSPTQPLRFTTQQLEQIARTVHRVPEAILKVTRSGRNVQQVKESISYFGRDGELAIETDNGVSLRGPGMGNFLADDWDLELEALRGRRRIDGKGGRQSRLTFHLMFSSAAGTPPQKVLAAARKFAQEKFALRHRYAMVLHTDRKNPHVHMVVKARSVDGVRLNTTKATLRQWRYDFACCLRELGVAVNATDRVMRGETRSRMKDGIYRAAIHGESTYVRKRVERVASELLRGGVVVEKGKVRLMESRKVLERGWMVIADALDHQGQRALAADVRRFVGSMPAPMTAKEQIAHQLMRHVQARTHERSARAR
jgi:hypothetical protein